MLGYLYSMVALNKAIQLQIGTKSDPQVPFSPQESGSELTTPVLKSMRRTDDCIPLSRQGDVIQIVRCTIICKVDP